MEETTFLCSPCGRTVPVGNRVMHSLVCGRHSAPSSSTPRDISEEEVVITIPTVSNIEPPLDSDSSSIDNEDVEQDLASLMVECEFCHLEYRAGVLDEHSHNCGTRTDVCDRCMHYVRLCDMRRHVDSGCTYGATGSAMASALGNETDTLLPPGNATNNTNNSTRRRRHNHNNRARPQPQQNFIEDVIGDDATTWATVGLAVGAVAAATAFSIMRPR